MTTKLTNVALVTNLTNSALCHLLNKNTKVNKWKNLYEEVRPAEC
jgi:hypothetical protein